MIMETKKTIRRNPGKTLRWDYDGATGARRLVGARPVEHGHGRGPQKKRSGIGGQGGLPPWAASPSGGERGSPSQISLSVTEGIFSEARLIS